jgi:hypothetical protein
MAILHAYFDESGKQGDHPVCTFSGVCVSQSRLAAFDDAWSVLLRQYALPSLHMAKASRLKENCGPNMPRHQSIDDRIAALIPFADCINTYLEYGISSAFDVKGFKSLSPQAKRGIGNPTDPQLLAFTRGIAEVCNYVQADDKLSLICDDDEATAWWCYAHYRAIRRVHDGLRDKVVSLSFANDRYFPALQAADMVAFLSRLEAKREFYGDYNMFKKLFDHLLKQRGAGYMRWFKMFANEEKLRDVGKGLEKLKLKKRKKKAK